MVLIEYFIFTKEEIESMVSTFSFHSIIITIRDLLFCYIKCGLFSSASHGTVYVTIEHSHSGIK